MNESRFELYWNDIPEGKQNAVTYAELMMWWNTNEREVRRILHELSGFDNGDDFVLIRSGQRKGFYKTDNKDEIEAFKKECLNKGRSVFAPVKKINRILSENAEQFSIENNLRVIRESLNIKQSEAVAYLNRFDDHFDAPMLSKMENGFCMPTPFQLAKLAQFYCCDPGDLINSDLYF